MCYNNAKLSPVLVVMSVMAVLVWLFAEMNRVGMLCDFLMLVRIPRKKFLSESKSLLLFPCLPSGLKEHHVTLQVTKKLSFIADNGGLSVQPCLLLSYTAGINATY